ncbi:hypothetical protein [Piscibacillus salipiscarius]|uniref:hypothetical protein n=1 Tax=Piscibacillus salipiscarius TaxID=299480 RepID=UPI002436A6CE|nr:hypothetical protein [Piscibacillus salipiscarius]
MGIKELFGFTSSDKNSFQLDEIWVDLGVEYFYKNLAVQSCVNLIANTLVRSKFRTYEKGKEKKGHNFIYLMFSPIRIRIAVSSFMSLYPSWFLITNV